MTTAWQIYLEELRRRADGVERQRFGRRDVLTAAAHDAYRVASDRLTAQHGWGDEHTLVLMRGFNAAVHDWLDRDEIDWDRLGEDLRRREDELATGFGPPPAAS